MSHFKLNQPVPGLELCCVEISLRPAMLLAGCRFMLSMCAARAEALAGAGEELGSLLPKSIRDCSAV